VNSFRIDNAMPQQLFQILTKAAIESLSKGDILQGRVQSLENGMLLIKLLDGSYFTAKVPESFSASPNDLLALEIGDKIDGQITAKVVYISNGSDASTEAVAGTNPEQHGQVSSSSIGADNSLINAVLDKLSSMGVKPSENLIQNTMKLIANNSELSLDEAVFMAANAIEPKPEMFKLIKALSEHEYKLSDNLLNLKNVLAENISKMDGAAREELLKSLSVSQALEKLSEKMEQVLKDKSLADSISENVRALLTKTILNEMSGKTENIGAKSLEELINNLLNADKKILSEVIPEKLSQDLDKLEFDQLVRIVHDTLEEVHTSTEKLKAGGEKEINSILDKLFEKAFFDTDADKITRQNIKDTFEAIKNIMEFSKEVLSRVDTQSFKAALPVINEVDQAFRFFAQVSTYDAMMQIPLKINGEQTTGELYVMKRKGKNKAINPNNFTLFLALNTASLGCVEAFLNSRDKCVSISVRVEKDELVRLFKENYKVLYDGLMKKGYKLADMKCRVIEEPRTGILNAQENTREYLESKTRVDLKI